MARVWITDYRPLVDWCAHKMAREIEQMGDTNPERDKSGEEGIISLKRQVRLEEHELPAYKRKKRKILIGFGILLIMAFLPQGLIGLRLIPIFFRFSYWPLAAVWLYLMWVWQRPENRELREWRKRRMESKDTDADPH